MSSFVRRLQKNIAKAQGFYRGQKGLIYDSNNEPVGKHWPKVAAPTKGK